MSVARQIILFLIDGMRPDGLNRADTPVMDRFMEAGKYTLQAQTVHPSETLPCHASLFYSVEPSQHGITTNVWPTADRPVVHNLFHCIHQLGRKTAQFFNWAELRDLAPPGAVDVSIFLNNLYEPQGAGDREIAAAAADWLRKRPVDFAFVYLGQTDIIGHVFGWMSETYLAAIHHADACIGHVMNAVREDAIVIITSDHGGHEKTHGSRLPEDLTIPLIVAGPSIGPGVLAPPIHITDIAPTIISLFGGVPPSTWSGRPILLFD